MFVPPFPYFGGKHRIAQQIVGHFPDHDRYCEPFAGSLAVLLAKPPEAIEVVNDLDSRLVRFWRTLRERGDELIRACELTPHSREEYENAKKGPDPDDPVEDARQLWLLYCQSISGAFEGAGWRAPGPTRKSAGQHFSRFAGRLNGLPERLAHVTLENNDYRKLITRFIDDEGCLFYVDPPYLDSTRTAGDQYRHDMSSPAEHTELIELLRQAKGPVLLSGYASDLYSELLPDWTEVQINTYTQNGAERVESLWLNRTPPEALFGGVLWEEE
jgi:DNA adenine methylase